MLADHLLRIAKKLGNVSDGHSRLLQENPRECMPETMGRRLVITSRLLVVCAPKISGPCCFALAVMRS
jgi:hypothetical protein